MIPVLGFLQTLQEANLLYRLLAVLAAGVLGAVAGGLLAVLLPKILIIQKKEHPQGKMPRWGVTASRVAGGILGMVIAALLLLGGGGTGGGKGGGKDRGQGTGTGSGSPGPTAPTVPTRPTTPTTPTRETSGEMTILVLNPELLPQPKAKVFRIEGQDQRLDLSEVKELIRKRKAGRLRVDVVRFKDSSTWDASAVAELVSWLKLEGLLREQKDRNEDAPRP